MNTSMTCLCGTTHTFAANEFLAQCTGCSLLLWRTEEPGDAPAAAVDARGEGPTGRPSAPSSR